MKSALDMRALFLRSLVIILFPISVMGQSLNLSVSQKTKSNSPSTFMLGGNKVQLTKDEVSFLSTDSKIDGLADMGISANGKIISVLKQAGEKANISLYKSDGHLLNTYSTFPLDRNDPSRAVFPMDNGSVILRNNISHFSFYDTEGESITSLSNSSGSEGGEKMSKVLVSNDQSTSLIYNPKIKWGKAFGSSVKAVEEDKSLKTVYESKKRHLRDVKISPNGQFIVLVTAATNKKDRVVILDQYGNSINKIDTDEQLVGATLSANSKYITLYSDGRVLVFNTISGKKLGATSFRSTRSTYLADYFPEDHTIIALTGDSGANDTIIKNSVFKAINLQKRSIADKKLSAPLGVNENLELRFSRSSNNSYKLKGVSKVVQISTRF